jgi:hypothetical protein
MSNFFHSLGLSSCAGSSSQSCAQLADQFDRRYQGLQFVIPLFLLVPLLIGLFWGAPLVARELELGTERLVWTQGITRRRWFSTKVLMPAATAAAGVAAFAALVSWWSGFFIQIHEDRFTQGIFDIRGVVPIAYALFALALGVLMGTLVRRTLPAMAATLGGFIAVRTLLTLYVRPYYIAPKVVSNAIVASGPKGIALGPQNVGSAWILHQVINSRVGTVANPSDLFGFFATHCPGGIPAPPTPPSPARLTACLQQLGIHTVTTYQPDSRFWAFQGIETAIYLALAALLIGAAAWVVRRKLA